MSALHQRRGSRPITPPLTITSRTSGAEVTLGVAGEIDLATSATLDLALDDAEQRQPRRIVLDLSELEFIDSSGLKVLCQAHERAEGEGHVLVLSNVPAATRRLFAITGIDALLAATVPERAA